MKKIILPILSFIILISLCGCNEDKSLTEKESPYNIQEINNISTDIFTAVIMYIFESDH